MPMFGLSGAEPIFTAKGRVRADPRQLQDTNRLAQTPLTRGDLGPLSLSELQAQRSRWMQTLRRPAEDPWHARGSARPGGTLHDPQLVLRTRVDGLGAASTQTDTSWSTSSTGTRRRWTSW